MTYIYRILVVFCISILLSSGAYMLCNAGQEKYRNHYVKYKEMFEGTTKYDVLMIGTSRTHRNIDTKICDSITGLSCFNAGISGSAFYEISTSFSAFFAVHPPVSKYLIFNIDDFTFNTKSSFFNPVLYFDFLDNPEIYAAFKYRNYPVWLYKHIPFTRIFEYNDDTRNNSLKGLTGFVNPEDLVYKGYSKMPVNHHIKKRKIDAYPVELLPDYHKNERLAKMLEFCNKNKIKIIFIVSPAYDNYFKKRVPNYDELAEHFREFATEKNALFWRFDTIPLCSEEKYFTDYMHLNRQGTSNFSTILANKIKEIPTVIN